MALFTKYRPTTFDEMVGNKHVIKAVKKLTNKKDIPHSWMFTGMSGSGKTTIARIIASKLGAKSSGIFEINASDLTGVDSVREIAKNCKYRVAGSPVSVYIFDECHMWSVSAQNAILKVLEDAPNHTYFILATTDPHKLLGTIRTRCEEFKFDPVEDNDIIDLLMAVAEKEEITLAEDIFIEIAANAAGSPRLALNMLERCSAVDTVEDAKKLVTGLGIDFQVEGDINTSGEIFNTLLSETNKKDAWDKISVILGKALDEKRNTDEIRKGLTGRMGKYLLKGNNRGLANAVLTIEKYRDTYSVAAFVAVLFKAVEEFYAGGTSVRTRESTTNIR